MAFIKTMEAVPNAEFTRDEATNYWNAIIAANETDGILRRVFERIGGRRGAKNFGDKNLLKALENCEMQFIPNPDAARKGKDRKFKTKLILASPQAEDLLRTNPIEDVTIEIPAVEPASEGQETSDIHVEQLVDVTARETTEATELSLPSVGRKYYGVLVRKCFFTESAIGDIVFNLDNYLKLVQDNTAGSTEAKDIFIGADVPYFSTTNSWDQPGFVGVSELEFPKHFVRNLCKVMQGRNGMAVIFCNELYQKGEIRKHLVDAKIQRQAGIREIVPLFVNREGYISYGAFRKDRKCLLSNVEVALQVTFGSPAVDYSLSQMFKDRSNSLSVKWDFRIRDEKKKTVNTAQKPVDFWVQFLKCVKCDVVVDLFAGTGSLSVAAASLNTSFIALEKGKKMCRVFDKRLRDVVRSSRDIDIIFFDKNSNICQVLHLDSAAVISKPSKKKSEPESELDEVSALDLSSTLDPQTLSPAKRAPIAKPGQTHRLPSERVESSDHESGNEMPVRKGKEKIVPPAATDIGFDEFICHVESDRQRPAKRKFDILRTSQSSSSSSHPLPETSTSSSARRLSTAGQQSSSRPLPPTAGESQPSSSSSRPLPETSTSSSARRFSTAGQQSSSRPLPPTAGESQPSSSSSRPLPETSTSSSARRLSTAGQQSSSRPLPPTAGESQPSSSSSRPLPPTAGGSKPSSSSNRPLPDIVSSSKPLLPGDESPRRSPRGVGLKRKIADEPDPIPSTVTPAGDPVKPVDSAKKIKKKKKTLRAERESKKSDVESGPEFPPNPK